MMVVIVVMKVTAVLEVTAAVALLVRKGWVGLPSSPPSSASGPASLPAASDLQFPTVVCRGESCVTASCKPLPRLPVTTAG